MDTVFISFANSTSEKLASLSYEDEQVNAILSRRKSMGDIDLLREQYASTNRLSETIAMYQNKLSVFLYSGHAGRDKLYLEDQNANSVGLAALLKECPNLKLVVLNGCSTKGQVELLLESGIPVVIATSAPVEDKSAAQFSIAFFTSLVERLNNIDKAFTDGVAAAQLVSNHKIPISRGIGMIKEFPKEKNDEPLWGLFYKPENKFYVEEWRIGVNDIEEEKFIPNELLLNSIWEAIKPHLYTNENVENFKRNDKIDKIITELPHPVSDYLRKLIASKRVGDKDEFYNELGENRLKYLIYTYTNCIEILTFTMLTQIWDEYRLGKIPGLSAELNQEIKSLFACNFKERKTYSLLPLIKEMRGCFETNQIDYFIEEFLVLSQTFNEKSELFYACHFMEKVREELIELENIDEQKAKKLCIDLEKQLAVIVGKLGFLVKYKMASMKGIEFIKYKHQSQPRFLHKYVELRYRPSGMNIESETLDDSMDNASVIFIHEKDGLTKYLNLSPFIIDVNSFDDKAQLADLCLFLSYETGLEAFTYRYIYKPTTFPLRVDKLKKYSSILYDQFEAFYQLFFNKSIES